MLTEALAALTMVGGNTLVSAMVTDGWEGVKVRFARLLGGSDPNANATAAAQLEESRSVLVEQHEDLQKAVASRHSVGDADHQWHAVRRPRGSGDRRGAAAFPGLRRSCERGRSVGRFGAPLAGGPVPLTLNRRRPDQA